MTCKHDKKSLIFSCFLQLDQIQNHFSLQEYPLKIVFTNCELDWWLMIDDGASLLTFICLTWLGWNWSKLQNSTLSSSSFVLKFLFYILALIGLILNIQNMFSTIHLQHYYLLFWHQRRNFYQCWSINRKLFVENSYDHETHEIRWFFFILVCKSIFFQTLFCCSVCFEGSM